jgi:DNA polymerase-3 subunit epsilon
MELVAVIDFETTGLSPTQGDRATEIAAVLWRDGQVVDRYQSLMNAGLRIPPYIEALTGISDAMIRQAPPAAEVMREVADFVGDHPLVAHNAAFDRKFWDAELQRIGRSRRQEFACSLLLARRLLPQAPSHKLGALVDFAGLPVAGRYHRALADAEMAASLLGCLEAELRERHRLDEVSHRLLCQLQGVPKHKLARWLTEHQRPASGQRAISAR